MHSQHRVRGLVVVVHACHLIIVVTIVHLLFVDSWRRYDDEQHLSSSSSSSQILPVFFSWDRLRMYAFSGRFFSSLQNGHELFFERASSRARWSFSVQKKTNNKKNAIS